jgi:hypothetical protein
MNKNDVCFAAFRELKINKRKNFINEMKNSKEQKKIDYNFLKIFYSDIVQNNIKQMIEKLKSK